MFCPDMIVCISWKYACLCRCDVDVICVTHDLNRGSVSW